VAVFSVEELQDTLRSMELVLTLPPPEHLPMLPSMAPLVTESAHRSIGAYVQEMSRYPIGELTPEGFMQKWNSAEPFVLVGVVDSATPAELLDLKEHGRRQCAMSFFDGDIWQHKTTTLSAYFKRWNSQQSSSGSFQIRVRGPVLHLISHIQVGIGLSPEEKLAERSSWALQ
jgi:hypothetical protein